MIGKKVYPKIIVDGVKFDSPAQLPDSSEEPEIISEIKQHMVKRGWTRLWRCGYGLLGRNTDSSRYSLTPNLQ
jgi:hypothetical protein